MKYLAAIVVSLISACALAQEPRSTIPVTIGGTPIELVAPKGYARVTPAAGELAALGEKFTPETNQLLAHFVKTTDLMRKARGRDVVFDRYFLVQGASKSAGKISPETFENIRKIFRTRQTELGQKLEPAVAKAALKAGSAKADDLAALARLKSGEFAPIGIYRDAERAFASGTLNRLQYNEGSYTADHLMVIITAVVILKERSLFLYTYAGFRSAEDVKWARSAALAWIDELQALNQ